MDNNNSNALCDKILLLNSNTGYPLPTKQEMLLLLNNFEMRNMLSYACDIIDKQKKIGEIRKVLAFNTLYNDKIMSLAHLKQKEEDLMTKVNERTIRLEKLKEKRIKIEKNNYQLLNLTKVNSKKRQLAEVKNKILSSSKIELDTLMNRLIKLSFIENYKYPHSKACVDLRDNDANTDFNINEYIEKASGLITLNNSLITQSDITTREKDNISSNINSKTIQLPKLTREELKSYIHLNQGDFWSQIKKSIETLLNSGLLKKKDRDSLFDQSSITNVLNNNIDNTQYEYSTICKSFLEAIQKEEEAISKQFNEIKLTVDAKDTDIFQDNLALTKAYKISKEDIKKISSYAKCKLAKDVLQCITAKTLSVLNLPKLSEFIIPQCIFKDDYNEIIAFEKNLIKTYRKYKQRTDFFISKRIIPLSDLLEEQYTDFTNTMRIEIDYFNKLNLNHFHKITNSYSLSRLKYDRKVLQSFRVYSKYDLFSLYFKYIDMIKRDFINGEKNKKIVDSIFKAKEYIEYLNKSKVMISITEFSKQFDFEQKYHLFIDDKGIELFKSFVELWGDVNHMNYDIDINCIKNRFR